MFFVLKMLGTATSKTLQPKRKAIKFLKKNIDFGYRSVEKQSKNQKLRELEQTLIQLIKQSQKDSV